MKVLIIRMLAFIIFESDVWIGCWILYLIPFTDWREFPMLVTCFSIAVICAYFFVYPDPEQSEKADVKDEEGRQFIARGELWPLEDVEPIKIQKGKL